MTGKSFDDMDRAERREVGEKLYANTKDAYTAGGSLIATIDGNILSLGTFTEGTFHITPEGRAAASEKGYLPPEPELQHPEEPVFGVPDDPENPPEDALPSDVPVRDPEPHPSQPIAGAPDAFSHRVEDPTGETDEGETLPEGATPITAGTLPDLIFSEPAPTESEPKEGEELEEPAEPAPPRIIKRPIAESFASEGGGTPVNPIRPTGVRQAKTPDPNAPPPDLIDNTLPPEGEGAPAAASASLGRRVKDAVLGKDDKSSKPKGKTQGRQLKLDLHDKVKATSKAKSS